MFRLFGRDRMPKTCIRDNLEPACRTTPNNPRFENRSVGFYQKHTSLLSMGLGRKAKADLWQFAPEVVPMQASMMGAVRTWGFGDRRDPWASLGLPGPLWASRGLPGPPWASLGLPGPPGGLPGPPGPPWAFWASLGFSGLPWGLPGPPWASLGLRAA